MCKGKGGTSACHYESMTEQTNTFRSTNKSYAKLTGLCFLYFTSVLTMGSIHKDKISKSFCLLLMLDYFPLPLLFYTFITK